MNKRLSEENCKEQVKAYSSSQQLDIFVVLALQLFSDVRNILKKGTKIKELLKSQKTHSFSSLPKINKHYGKDKLLSTFNDYYSNEVVSSVYSKMLLNLVQGTQ